ncbi:MULTISPECIES: hypothetical protein [Rhodococcus]|uniref:Uncharacterized protein n=1 Tax=Rhodococcus oxybenzonivorans TaxID=1990687 RepID=A0AAE5A4M9_9NOCA|nr:MULTISPECIES: hypothetical protein [Rhodococcus]MDV7244877.1 hypothetical protein [Rhodococcus oxybenzonivorans]MDV7263676.1 hypothetical protein [Rhodococcus oxybenzonivorans]MDV7275624.1 hypothetical protein [Rhodococcus oxybenzonivorans]MDV7332401.1 hypothetical protein [Rhodococcus oxybenzonivorans]MDV7346197.1 hypothetical protein [Rhodococcus oxybenzonivorans]
MLTPTASRPPTFGPAVSRRAALRLAAVSAVGATGVALLAGCTEDTNDRAEVDSLVAQSQLARRDAAGAAAAIALLPDRSAALDLVRVQRTAHADALDAEIARAAGTYPDGTTPTTSPSASAAPTVPVPPPTLDQLRAELAESQRSAADSARTLSGYRAGLSASISAACATYLAVVLS